MSRRAVVLWPDPLLGMVCDAVDGVDLSLIEDLFDTMYVAKGRGLAAPQIGVMQRVFVVDVSWKEGKPDPRVFVNPVIETGGEDVATMEEQCLSIPDLPMPVERPLDVTVSWDTPDGERMRDTFTGVLARCIQHEFDHLNGRVILDHQTPERRAELEAAYGR